MQIFLRAASFGRWSRTESSTITAQADRDIREHIAQNELHARQARIPMADTVRVENWYLRAGGLQTVPFSEAHLLVLIQGGLVDAQIRPDSAADDFPWLPLDSQAPFAEAARRVRERDAIVQPVRSSKPLLYWVNGALVLALAGTLLLHLRGTGPARADATLTPKPTAVGAGSVQQLEGGPKRLNANPIEWTIQVSGEAKSEFEPGSKGD